MKNNKWVQLLTAVVIISLLAAVYTAYKRYDLERQHREVALAVVYDEVANLARMKGISPVEALEQFGASGVTTVLLKETTVGDAVQNGEFIHRTGRELLLLNDSGLPGRLNGEFSTQIKPDFRYLIFSDQLVFERVKGQLAAKEAPVKTWELDGIYIIETGLGWVSVENLGIGFPKSAVNDVQSAGMDIIVQVRTWSQVTPEGLHRVFREIAKIDNLTGLAFNDPVLPGVPGLIRPLAYEIQDLGVPIVQIEFSNQIGLAGLGLMLDKNVLRLHTITLEEDAKRNYSLAGMVDRFTLAAEERNNRVLLFHTYSKADAPDMLQMNLQLVEKVRDRLTAGGMQVGDASLLQLLNLSRLVTFVTGLGVIAGGMLLAFAMGWGRAAPYLGLVGLLLWTALLALDVVNPARKLMAFAAVVIFPTLALALNVRREGSSPGRCVLLLVQTSLLSLVGALLMVGLLADVGFMLKLDQFTGVKLAHVLPLALVAGIFFFRGSGEEGGWRGRLQSFLDQPVLVKFAVAAGFLLVVLLVYVSRTGNETVAISSLELKFRTLLDNLLGVRPRTKEFLLGHPLLLLLFYLGFRDNRCQPLLLAGVIGQVSLVNTYAHIHTPLAVSLLRSFNGLWIGIIGGLVLIVLWQVGRRLAEKYLPPLE